MASRLERKSLGVQRESDQECLEPIKSEIRANVSCPECIGPVGIPKGARST